VSVEKWFAPVGVFVQILAESFELITAMLDQVLSFHPHAQAFHIGCDEVCVLFLWKRNQPQISPGRSNICFNPS
jgi:hypothetical protein